MQFKNLTILYVEDDMDTQLLMESILQESFKKVFVASDGEEGLALYQTTQPDIVLSDIHMPKMDGLSMSAAIKEINPTQLIALFTAFNESEHLDKAAKLGIDTYIMKPLDKQQFFNSLSFLALTLDTNKRG
ncbi:MAG: Diguanylate cyclase/phosphodiesterase (GGDEF & EAL domains) with PAS/PAC sensor(S) [uncultured Sulfurovum sp.]|uniref:Diguanylate cyclase/phosphodiesterase (GGDEF & EAL domains) with PAS/PAC sensor(S) n=1 Tax=uncultured Sulfurovum sp. TaxID=269237 RepID=A0A6S6SGU4_9BACT|nr:MAG: Diguanylate cyclase/phosphodiesterase (GGDEF & EAL domains) with PAS/PAC sensor(S) [uncultured Sulfurovum sp.]